MRGYIIVPDTYSCAPCKYCGARPIIAVADGGEYVVKCPNDATHYQTQPGLIDIDDWNEHNPASVHEQAETQQDHFFHLNGTIVSLRQAD